MAEQAVSDAVSGRLSETEKYARKALAGSVVGFLTGASGLLMQGSGLGKVLALGFGEGFLGSIATQSLLNEDGEINWALAFGEGASSAIINVGAWKIGGNAKRIEGGSDVLEGISKKNSSINDLTQDALEGISKKISSINDLTQEQINAIRRYTGEYYSNINNSLRGFETATPENKVAIDIMKEALSNASLPNDMILYRGTTTKALGALEGLPPDELVGRIIYEDAFMSTSTNSRVALKTFSGNMQMTIEAPKGSNALDVAPLSEYPESEILFNAGQSMLITSAEQRNGILYITVRIQ